MRFGACLKPAGSTGVPVNIGVLVAALVCVSPASAAPPSFESGAASGTGARDLESRNEVPEAVADEGKAGETDAAEEPQGVKIGGALRFNYFVKDYDEDIKTRRGDAGLDIFRINADGDLGGLQVSAEYRFYSYMSTIHHGYVGYPSGDHGEIQGGIMRVPFGLLPYAAHNFWFGVPYYTGLSDDYDLGIKYLYKRDAWDWRLAFFKNEELGSPADLERYSYDPVAVGAARNEETNTVNARAAYTLGRGECTHEAGVSAQRGELFNLDTGDTGEHWAVAPHLDSHCGRWNVQLEAARYGYDARNPAGTDDDTITFGAFAATHEVAARGTVYVANIAYNVPTPWSGVKLLTCYNDYSVLDKDAEGFVDSRLNTTGCLLNIGPTYTYIDVIQGRNMVFLGGGSLGDGGDDEWHTRFNVNFGVYW